ncbi:DUF4167 domain-containing protein [Roseovarius salinarum]|uniref:DUF4167 domain-containing protein n=1 Tax=Roseovarius salinarum TaxID=1981892 RepID=UPI000C33C903|nr:DUF4167 domain-containing protein [Roseovarius salinarum]
MRSSKSRSRNKSGRSRSMGNIVNRVFESSGPEGKVRGTPQQIIDKYNQLARDAQLGNDRVAAENFQQHAEHYLRMLGAAQKEQDQRREEQERQNRERQAERDRERSKRQERDSGGGSEQPDAAEAAQPDVVDSGSEDSGLVETPENKSQGKRGRKPKQKSKARSENASGEGSDSSSGEGNDQGTGDDGNDEQSGDSGGSGTAAAAE